MLPETMEVLQPLRVGCGVSAEVAALHRPLQELAAELRALRGARARTAASLQALCEVAAGCGCAGGGKPALEGESSTVAAEREVAPEIVQSPDQHSSPCMTASGASPHAEGCALGAGSDTLDDDAAAPADVWAEEVLGRVRGAVERSRRDPQEVFFRFCSHGLDVLRREDLGRVLQAFEPNLPEVLQRRLWHTLGKADGDALTLAEFRRLCGPPEGREEEGGGAAAAEAASTGSTDGTSDAEEPLDPAVSGRRDSAPLDERRARALLYRFGRGIDFEDSDVRQELFRPGDGSGLSVQELLEASSRHDIPLSRVEIVALFWRFGGASGAVHRAEFFREALRAASTEPPPEVARAREALAAAAERGEEEGRALRGELLRVCGKEGAADAGVIRALLTGYAPLDDQHWEALDLALGKRPDGALLLAPLLELAGLAPAEAAGPAPPATPLLGPKPGGRRDLHGGSWLPRNSPRGSLPPVREEGEEEGEDSSGSGAEA